MRSLPSPAVLLAAIGIAVAAGAAQAPQAVRGPVPGRPNIILITLDTTRADRLGCYGRAGAATPNLDALARAGALFESAISPAPLTLPSHATIMTGLVPRRHGVRDNALFRLDPTHRTIASILRAAGYSTAAAVGASVLDRSTGIGQGFGVYDDRVRVGQRSEFNFEERAASQVTATARELLDSLPAPFFLWVHYYDPHYPYVPPLPYARAFSASPYDGELAFVDEAVGRLLEGLRAKGAEAATLVAVAGDHGESLGEHGEDRHDLFLYQATQRVPLILKGPGVARGRRIARNVGLTDLLPTILEFAGLPCPPGVDGESLAPDVRLQGPSRRPGGGPGKDRVFELESFFPAYSYNWAPPLALVSGRWKYIASPRPELYDLESDPTEARNLLGSPRGTTAPPGGAAPPGASSREAAARLAAEIRSRYANDPAARAFEAPPCSPQVETACAALAAPGAATTSAPGAPAPPGSGPGAPPGPGASGAGAGEPAIDPEAAEQLERLRALGYAGGSAVPGRTPSPGPHLDPKDGAPIVRELDRARALLQAGDPAGASRLLLPLAARDARNFPLLCTLGAAHQAAGAYDAAVESYRRAVALRPDYGLSHSGLAGALRARAASLDGATPGAPGRAGTSAAQAQADALRQESAGEYEKALALDPRSSDDYLSYAELELERSRPGPARAVLDRADRADALDPELALLAGRLAFAAGDARRAEALYARALDLAPTIATARTLGAIRLDALDDPAGALAAFRRALELARGGPEARELEQLVRDLEASRR